MLLQVIPLVWDFATSAYEAFTNTTPKCTNSDEWRKHAGIRSYNIRIYVLISEIEDIDTLYMRVFHGSALSLKLLEYNLN